MLPSQSILIKINVLKFLHMGSPTFQPHLLYVHWVYKDLCKLFKEEKNCWVTCTLIKESYRDVDNPDQLRALAFSTLS